MGDELRALRRAVRCGFLLAAGGMSVNAAAMAADDGAGQSQQQQQLQEVVVTAQKMRQTLEQVPASVTSVSGDYIRSTGARDFQELSSYTANTNLQVSSSSTQLLVRGFGTLNDVPGLDPSVGVMVDGVVYTYPEYLSAFFSDLDRYEVLRGPQGTLSGKNVTAGLLNITTNAPDNERLIRVDADMRSSGNLAFRPVINLPLGPDAAVRFSGNFQHGDRGVLYNTDLNRREGNQQQDSGRMRFRYDSHAGWTMDVGAFVAYNVQNFNKQQLYIVGPNMLVLDRSYDPRFNPVVNNFLSEDVHATQNASTRGASVTFEGDLGNPGGMKSLKLTSITSVTENLIGSRDLDGDFSPVPFIKDSLAQTEPERQFTQELRVTGVGQNFFGLGHEANFVAGLYYDNYTLKTSDDFSVEDLGATFNYVLAAGCDSNKIPVALCSPVSKLLGNAVDGLLNTINTVLGQPLIGTQNAISGLDQRTKDYAAFGQGEWYFVDHWSLIAGLRYAKENRKGQPHSFSDSLIIKAIADQTNFDYAGAAALHRTETDFSPKAGLKYQPSKHLEGYFTWAEGYKSGGFNGIPLNPDSIEYEPEKAASLEAGLKIKDRLLNGPIRGSFSIYHTHFSNLQVSTFQGTNVIIVNAAEAHSQGFEADLMWLLPIRGMSLYSSFGFADARYVRYPDGPAPGDFDCGTVGTAAPAQCTCPSDSGKLPGTKRSGCGKNLTGQPLPFAPQWTATLTPAYTFLHLPYAVSVSAATDILYQGQRYLNSEDDPRQLQKSTLVINPRLVFADEANGDWGLSVGIQNITHQIYGDQVIDQPLGAGNFAEIRGDNGRFYSGNFFINFH